MYPNQQPRNPDTGKPFAPTRNAGRTNLPQPPRAVSPGELVLIRGLPGSGKSTMARQFVALGYRHFEADMFFVVDGEYRYDPSRIKEAHAWCQAQTRQALSEGHSVVVSNTFTRLNEMDPYRRMTTRLRIVEATGRWPNVHGVPDFVLTRMAERWEKLPNVERAEAGGRI